MRLFRPPRRPGFALVSALAVAAGIIVLTALLIVLFAPRHRKPPVAATAAAPARRKGDLGDTFNILMTGRDARLIGDPSQDGKQRNKRENVYHSDVIIVAHFNLPLRRVTLLSIPRDMLVEIPGYTHAENRTDFSNLDKITHASAYGRDSLLIRTVEKFLGIKIKRRVALDFDSFRLLFAMLKPFIGKLTFGNRELNSPDSALMFVRDRRHYANDDLDRSRHSVLFVKTIVQRLWPKLNNRLLAALAPRAFGLLGPDTDLSADDMSYIIAELQRARFKPDSIETAVAIGEEGPVTLWSYGQTLSCCLPNYGEIQKQVDFYLKDRLDVAAFSFMEQNQKIRWPGYVFEDYDYMPETTHVDTANPVLKRLQMEKELLTTKDTGKIKRVDSAANKDTLKTVARPDTGKATQEPGKTLAPAPAAPKKPKTGKK